MHAETYTEIDMPIHNVNTVLRLSFRCSTNKKSMTKSNIGEAKYNPLININRIKPNTLPVSHIHINTIENNSFKFFIFLKSF